MHNVIGPDRSERQFANFDVLLAFADTDLNVHDAQFFQLLVDQIGVTVEVTGKRNRDAGDILAGLAVDIILPVSELTGAAVTAEALDIVAFAGLEEDFVDQTVFTADEQGMNVVVGLAVRIGFAFYGVEFSELSEQFGNRVPDLGLAVVFDDDGHRQDIVELGDLVVLRIDLTLAGIRCLFERAVGGLDAADDLHIREHGLQLGDLSVHMRRKVFIREAGAAGHCGRNACLGDFVADLLVLGRVLQQEDTIAQDFHQVRTVEARGQRDVDIFCFTQEGLFALGQAVAGSRLIGDHVIQANKAFGDGQSQDVGLSVGTRFGNTASEFDNQVNVVLDQLLSSQLVVGLLPSHNRIRIVTQVQNAAEAGYEAQGLVDLGVHTAV